MLSLCKWYAEKRFRTVQTVQGQEKFLSLSSKSAIN